MALVNSISKTDQIRTSSDFASAFLGQLIKITANSERLVFKIYIRNEMNVIGLYMILLMIYMYPPLPMETCPYWKREIE